MIIGIGTANSPKIAACKAVVKRITYKLNVVRELEFIAQNTLSGVPDMPLNQNDMMCGAQNRALSLSRELYNKKIITTYTIGLEFAFAPFYNQQIYG